jgi:hypothetical protein
MAFNNDREQVPGPLEMQIPGPLEVPDPFEAKHPGLFEAPFGVGAFASDSGLDTAEKRVEWLRTRPAEAAIVLAGRAALRVVPAFSLAFDPTGSRMTRRRMLLRIFRAVATAWSLSAFPGSYDNLKESARRSLAGLGNVRLPPVERAAAYALAAIVAPNSDTAARAKTAIEYALDAAGAKGKAAFDLMLDAIRTDASLLDQRFSPVTLANSKLWPGQVPDWIQELWGELKQRLSTENEGWEVWTRWYDARLAGEFSSDQVELRWAAISEDAWERELATVNRALQALAITAEHPPEQGTSEPMGAQPGRPGKLQGVQAVGQAGTILGQVSMAATAEVIPNPAVEAVVSRIKSDPQQFEDVARFAARSIERELKELATRIPNESRAPLAISSVSLRWSRFRSP